jgi:hypothetical protein
MINQRTAWEQSKETPDQTVEALLQGGQRGSLTPSSLFCPSPAGEPMTASPKPLPTIPARSFRVLRSGYLGRPSFWYSQLSTDSYFCRPFNRASAASNMSTVPGNTVLSI